MSWTKGRPPKPSGAGAIRRSVLAANGGLCACDGCVACAGWGRTGIADEVAADMAGARARALAIDNEALIDERVQAMRAGRLSRQEISMLGEGIKGGAGNGHCVRAATDDDHVIGVANGLSNGMSIQELNDPSNHRGLCHECHEEKTKIERKQGQARRARNVRFEEDHPGLKK